MNKLGEKLFGEIEYNTALQNGELNDVAINDQWFLPSLLTSGILGYQYRGLINPMNLVGNIKSLRYLPQKIREWGPAYLKYIGNPGRAIKKLKETQEGFVPNADGNGTDFLWGEYIAPIKEGKKGGGYGLSHIEGRRNEQGYNGSEFLDEIPDLLNNGQEYLKSKHNDRYYIGDGIKEGIIRTDYNGKPWEWLNSVYYLDK